MLDISKYQGKSKEDVYNILKEDQTLSNLDKNKIWVYLFPEPLKDMELPSVIMEGRKDHKEGYLSPNDQETLHLLRAYRTLQYRKFILHLLHTFIENEKETYVVSEKGNYLCAGCNKPLYAHEEWSELCKQSPAFGEQNRKEYLAFGNDQTNLKICIDCMIQLKNLNDWLIDIEGPHYLMWGKKKESN